MSAERAGQSRRCGRWGPETLPFLSCAGATIREHAEALDRAICALPPPASHVGFLEDATLQCGRLPGKVA